MSLQDQHHDLASLDLKKADKSDRLSYALVDLFFLGSNKFCKKRVSDVKWIQEPLIDPMIQLHSSWFLFWRSNPDAPLLLVVRSGSMAPEEISPSLSVIVRKAVAQIKNCSEDSAARGKLSTGSDFLFFHTIVLGNDYSCCIFRFRFSFFFFALFLPIDFSFSHICILHLG